MKLYLAGYSTGKKRLPTVDFGQNYLETYLVARKWNLEEEYKWSKKKWFLDSGAFSAKTLGIKIDIEDYIDFIIRNKKYFEVYANLDVIGDAEATDKNQKLMESKGLLPLPTYHLGEPKEYFIELVENYDYMGIGGLVPYARKPKKIEDCLNYCFGYVMKNKLKTKFHGWGMTNPVFMKTYPFYSVDSTGWLGGGKFKTMLFFDNGKLKSMNAEKIRKNFGVDWGKKHYFELDVHNVREYYKYADYCTKLHQVRGMEYWI